MDEVQSILKQLRSTARRVARASDALSVDHRRPKDWLVLNRGKAEQECTRALKKLHVPVDLGRWLSASNGFQLRLEDRSLRILSLEELAPARQKTLWKDIQARVPSIKAEGQLVGVDPFTAARLLQRDKDLVLLGPDGGRRRYRSITHLVEQALEYQSWMAEHLEEEAVERKRPRVSQERVDKTLQAHLRDMARPALFGNVGAGADVEGDRVAGFASWPANKPWFGSYGQPLALWLQVRASVLADLVPVPPGAHHLLLLGPADSNDLDPEGANLLALWVPYVPVAERMPPPRGARGLAVRGERLTFRSGVDFPSALDLPSAQQEDAVEHVVSRTGCTEAQAHDAMESFVAATPCVKVGGYAARQQDWATPRGTRFVLQFDPPELEDTRLYVFQDEKNPARLLVRFDMT